MPNFSCSRVCSSRRVRSHCAMLRTTTCAESAVRLPDNTQTCRSWTDSTPSTPAISPPMVSTERPCGTPSISACRLSRSSRTLETAIRTQITSEASGSMRVQPLNAITAPEISAATEPSASPATCSRAARAFMSWPCGASHRMTPRLIASPARASAAPSVSMWPASDSRAREPVHQPPSASTTANATVSAAAPRSAVPELWSWWCSAMSQQPGEDLLERTRVVSAPGDNLIRADEYRIGAVEVPGLFAFQIDDPEVDVLRLFEFRAVRCQTQQRPVEAKAIVKGLPGGEPEMRRTPARTGARQVCIHGFGRRLGAVRNDGRRTIIAAAEGDARDVELRAAVRFQIFSRAPARGIALRGVVLDFGRRRVQAERIGEALGVRRIPERERPALGLVALEQLRRGLPLQHRGELPAQIHGVLDRGVVAEPAGRREEVRRVAADEHPPVAEMFGYKRMPGGPEVARQHLHLERYADRRLHHSRGPGFGNRFFIFMVFQLRVEREFALPVDGRHETAALAVEAHVHPRRRVRHLAIEVRNARIDCVHAPADEIAADAGFAGVANAETLPRQAAR